jgi:hypothetical protein
VLRALTLVRERTSARAVATPTPSSCRSRGARARVHSRSFARSSALRSGFAPATSRPFWVSDLLEVLLRLGSGSRSRAILPALSPHDVTRVGDPGELGPLPLGYFSLGGAQHVRLGLPGARGCGPAATPVLSTDVCCSRMLFSKTIASRLGARRIVMFPHDARARGFTPQCPLRRAVGWRRGVVSLDGRSRRRTSDAPSLAGFPGGTMSTGVGPRSHNDLRSKNPRA